MTILGLGKTKELTQDKIRIALADACRALRKKGAKHIDTALVGVGVNDITVETSAQAITEGAILGLYTFTRHIIFLSYILFFSTIILYIITEKYIQKSPKKML